MVDSKAIVTRKRSISAIWIVPLVALVLGGWMVIHSYLNRGPDITIIFSNAEGIEPGKTKIKALNVDVGVVQSVRLLAELNSVVVHARMKPEVTSLLRKDTKFWVVRPRIASSGISGLSTLLSGAYIELAPGTAERSEQHNFHGLRDVPVTPPNRPGLHLILISDEGASVDTGDPVLYRGVKVGRVESSSLVPVSRQVRSAIFIEESYESLVTTNTRFWNASGFSFKASAEGVSLSSESLEALLVGGVAFDLPQGGESGSKVEDFCEFLLFPDYDSINVQPFTHYIDYLLLFDYSVRGLHPGAPVEFRGLQIGRVLGISLDYVPDEMRHAGRPTVPIPVLIRMAPGYLGGKDSEEYMEYMVEQLNKGVASGLRASLKSANLLTGNLFISLDYVKDAGAGEMKIVGQYKTIPTVSSGLEMIQTKIIGFVDTLNRLPLETTFGKVGSTIEKMKKTVHNVNVTIEGIDAIIKNSQTQKIPQEVNLTLADIRSAVANLKADYSTDSPIFIELDRTLRQLRQTLQAVERLSSTIENQPNTLLFSDPKLPDLIPEVSGQ